MNAPHPCASIVAVVVLCSTLTGCASTYQVSTFDGQVFETHTAPQLKNGSYRFSIENGQVVTLPYVKVKSVDRS